ncbi:MAG: SDR family NAD(P)-dependent oxidoreductase [Moraxellaceae bacterium]
MTTHRLDGRVAIVTGAGGGLGRQHALTLAVLGAKVVVNDLGGKPDGQGQSSSAADQVVAEIVAAGGIAVANYDSVEHGQAIVQTALDAFGTVDIVINNAGILRDVSFAKMTEAEWDIILRVHLNGSMSVSHAAWPIMRAKNYGRIIMTTSAAGIYGNFGQANYCAAKLGILGLANCLAEEGRSKNIHVNTIAPLAASRLTEALLPPDVLALLSPEAVSPLVAWLCHEDCTETKGLFEVGAGYIGKLRWQRAEGYHFDAKRGFDIDAVANRWNKITDFSEVSYPNSPTESFMPIIEQANQPKLGGNEFIDLDLAAKSELVLESAYDERDLALYALGVGAARDPLDPDELKFVYELGGEFTGLATYAAMPQLNALLTAAKQGELSLPGCNFGLDRLLHGEQYTELYQPIPRTAHLKHVFKLKSAYDKKPHAVITFGVTSSNADGEVVAYNEMTSFVKGAGGWGGDRGPSGEVNMPPDRAPDAVITEKTDANQTLLYRLSGDWNPLHADPNFAKAFGFDKPILHGMCTHGYCGRHVVKAFCDNDPRLVKNIKVRFAKSVYPGDTLETRMWKQSDTQIVFETRVVERDEIVIKNAAVELYREVPKPASKTKKSDAPAISAVEPVSDGLTPADIFSVIDAHIQANPDLAAKTKTVFQFNLSNPDSQWVIDLKNAQGRAYQGKAEQADVSIDLDQALLETVVTASLPEVQKLYFAGQIKIGGNVMASNKLTVLQAVDTKKYQVAQQKRLGSTTTTSQPTAVSEPTQQQTAETGQATQIFAQLAQKLRQADLSHLSGALQFSLTEPVDAWYIDPQHAVCVQQGHAAQSLTQVTLSDAALVKLSTGEARAQQLYQMGQLRIDGDITAAHRLDDLFNIQGA